MPEPYGTFLKVSELKRPIKIETLNVLKSYDDDIDFTYHSTKLLPEYCFPLGLNIIDKIKLMVKKSKLKQCRKRSFRRSRHSRHSSHSRERSCQLNQKMT